MRTKRILSLFIATVMLLCSFNLTFAADNTICTLSVGSACSVYNTADYDGEYGEYFYVNTHGDEDAVISYVVYYPDSSPNMERRIPAYGGIYCPPGARCDIELVSGSYVTLEADCDGFTYSSLSHSPLAEYTLSPGERIRAANIGADDEIQFVSNPAPVMLSYISYAGDTRYEFDLAREKEFEATAIEFFDIYTTSGGDIDLELVSGPAITVYGAYENFKFQTLDHELFKEFEIGPGESICIKHTAPDETNGGLIYYWPNPDQTERPIIASQSYHANGEIYFLWSEWEVVGHKEDEGFMGNGHYIPPCGTIDWVFMEGMRGHFFGAYENYELVTSTETNTTYSDAINKASEPEPLAAEDAVMANSLGINSDSFLIKSSNSDTLKGPEISVLGKKFNLFEIPLNLNFKTSAFSVKYNAEEDKYEIIIGALDKTKLKGEDKIHETFMEIKEFANAIGKETGKSAWKKYDHIKRYLKRDKMDIGFSFNATLVGYMEFDKDANPLEGSLVYLIELDANYKQPFPPAPVCYVKVGLEVEGSGKFGFKIEETNNWEMLIKLALELSPYVGLGAGSEKLINAELGAKLKLGAEIEPLNNKKMEEILSATLTGSLYIKIRALSFMSFERDFDIEKVSIYPDFGASLMSVAENRDEMTVMPRDFMKTESVFMANSNIELFSNETAPSTFMTNVYPYAEPQLVSLADGKKLMVWVDNDPDRSDINCTVLKYSFYDGESWSDPADIYNDGCASFAPSLAVTSEGAVLAWQKANYELSDDASLDDMAKAMDIYFAEFYGGGWSEPYPITQDNEDYEFAPIVAANKDSYVVSWTTNSENDCFAFTGTNTLWCKDYTDGWKDTRRIAAGLGCVTDIAATYVDDNYVVAYTVDTDASVETADDVELFEYCDGQIVRITKDALAEYSLTKTDNGYCWIHENQMWERSGNGVSTIDIPVSAAYLDNAKIYANDTKKVIVYERAEDFSSDLYAIYHDSLTDAWGEPIRLTNDAKKIRDTNGYITTDGELHLVFGQAEINETADDIYGICNLMQLTVGDRCDVSVEDAVCYVADYKAGAEAKVYVDVKNNSTFAMDNFDVKLESDGETLISKGVVQNILPGETETFELDFALGEDLSHRSYTVTVTPKEHSDNSLSDNTADFETGFADLEVSASVQEGTISAVVSNSGVLPAQNVVCTLSDTHGSIIGKKSIDALDAGASVSFSFENVTSQLLTLTLTSDSEENAYANNSLTLHLTPLEPKGINVALGEYTATSEKLSVSTTVANDSDEESDIAVYIAYYKGNTLVSVERSNITLDAGKSNTILSERPASDGIDRVKMFVWHPTSALVSYNPPVELAVVYPDKSDE